MFLSAGTLYAAVGTTDLGGVQDGDVLASMRGATLRAAQKVRACCSTLPFRRMAMSGIKSPPA